MDDLTPALLIAIREIRWHLLAGRSIKESINAYLSTHADEFSVRLHEFWSLKIQGHAPVCGQKFASHRAQALWDLIERAYHGQPILEPLALLEDDVEAAATADLEMHVATLPFKALIPLLLLQFPAFALLLLGPLLRDLTRYSMIFILAAVGLSLAPTAGADTLSSAAFRKISQTRKVRDLDQIRISFEQLRTLRMACEFQLKEGSVPSACYEALELERKWGLSSSSHSTQIRERIDRRCEEAAKKQQGLNGVLPKAVSAFCRTNVTRAKELRDYQQFDWRGS